MVRMRLAASPFLIQAWAVSLFFQIKGLRQGRVEVRRITWAWRIERPGLLPGALRDGRGH